MNDRVKEAVDTATAELDAMLGDFDKAIAAQLGRERKLGETKGRLDAETAALAEREVALAAAVARIAPLLRAVEGAQEAAREREAAAAILADIRAERAAAKAEDGERRATLDAEALVLSGIRAQVEKRAATLDAREAAVARREAEAEVRETKFRDALAVLNRGGA